MTDREQLGEIEAYYKIVGNIVEAEWIWLIETLKKYMDRCELPNRCEYAMIKDAYLDVMNIRAEIKIKSSDFLSLLNIIEKQYE